MSYKMRNTLQKSKIILIMWLEERFQRMSPLLPINRWMEGIWRSKVLQFWEFSQNGVNNYGTNSVKRTISSTENRMWEYSRRVGT